MEEIELGAVRPTLAPSGNLGVFRTKIPSVISTRTHQVSLVATHCCYRGHAHAARHHISRTATVSKEVAAGELRAVGSKQQQPSEKRHISLHFDGFSHSAKFRPCISQKEQRFWTSNRDMRTLGPDGFASCT